MNDQDLLSAFYEDIKENHDTYPYKKSFGYMLNKLNEPYRTQALENTRELNKNGEQFLQHEHSFEMTMHYVITNAFIWNDTPQGSDYWRNVRKSLKDGSPSFMMEYS